MALEIQILFDIAIILIAAKILGEITDRLKISSLVGEVLGGLIVGPILLLVQPNDFLAQLANLGVLFLVFIIGLNTKFDDLKRDVYKGSTLAVAGALLSLAAGFVLGFYIFGSLDVAIVVGVAVASTSTAISLRSLIDVGEFRTALYHKVTVLLTADDVVSILLLSFLTSYFTFGAVEIWKVGALFFAVIGFFFLILTAGSRLVSTTLDVLGKLKDEQILIAFPLVIVFIVAFLSEHVGMAGVTGAFLAGMAMNRSPLAESVITPKMKTIGDGFFIPIFFAYSALALDLTTFAEFWPVIILLVAVTAITKLIGSGLLARIYSMNKKEQLVLGASAIPRGEYSIIAAQFALAAGILTGQIYTVILSFVILSIIITPIVLHLAHRAKA